jgi:hypothetical protein
LNWAKSPRKNPRVKNFSAEEHQGRNEHYKNRNQQSRDNILKIDQVHSLVHDTIGNAAGHRRAKREAKQQKSAQRRADKLEPPKKSG